MQSSVILGSDSQALNCALGNQNAHPGLYLIDEMHNSAEQLQAKQDGLFNADERKSAIHAGRKWKGWTRDVIDIQLHWILAHSDFRPNKKGRRRGQVCSTR